MTYPDNARPTLIKRLDIEVDIAPALILGEVAEGTRMNYPITGGRFTLFCPSTDQITGSVMPGGYDYFLEMADATGRLDAVYSLMTDAGELINIRNQGWLTLTAEGQLQVQAGIWPVARKDYHCRCSPVLQAARGRLNWLNTAVLIGEVDYPSDSKVMIRCYALA